MTLFDEPPQTASAPGRRWSRSAQAGLWAIIIALAVLLTISFLPTGYVIQQPGPVYDTLGSAEAADGSEIPLVSIEGAETYPTTGSLDLVTVQVVGNREHPPTWFELALAWFDRSRAVIPIEAVFPAGQTTEQRNEESATMMVDSQMEATAAALAHLDYEVGARLAVQQIPEDSPSVGVLEEGDVIRAADGTAIDTVETLREVVNAADGAAVSLDIERDGADRTVEVTPAEGEAEDGSPTWLIGIGAMMEYDFPVDVTIQLDNVGGPSAGMMFALGIMDVLTPDDLAGGADVAGTGTITADGTVGGIGGIRQKLYGARDKGADYFLAPASNCNEVVGHVPDGIRVFSVEDLDDALDVLETVRTDGDLDALPTCA